MGTKNSTVKKVHGQEKDAVERGKIQAQREFAEEEQRRRKRQQSEAMEELKERVAKEKRCLEAYEPGTMIGPTEFEDIDLSDITSIRIAVIGPTGGGKTCFINLVETILLGEDHVTAIPQSASGEGGLYLLPHLSELNFRLLDSRGFFGLGEQFKDELIKILSGRIKEHEPIPRPDDSYGDHQHLRSIIAKRPIATLSECIHGIICVLDYDDPKFMEYADEAKEYRQLLRQNGYSPVAVVTYKHDKTSKELTKDEKENRQMEAAKSIGSSLDRTFSLENHVALGTNITLDSEMTIVEVLKTALMGAEGFVKVQKQLEKYKMEDEIRDMLTEDQRMCIVDFMRSLGEKYDWSKKEVSEIIAIFDSNYIDTVERLQRKWDEVEGMVVSWAIRQLIKEELDDMFL